MFIMIKKSYLLSKGMTLIEVTLGILFLGIAFVGTLYAVRAIEEESNVMVALIEGTAFGNSIMEVVRSHNYDENASSPWSNPLGPESGESATTYDDVDDYYGGYTWTYPEYPAFTAKTRIFYVDPDVSIFDSVGTVQNYKRIIVHIFNDAFDEKISISAIITP
mgnify:FL=1|jgi:type II secretory pathway pseudopilin PulG